MIVFGIQPEQIEFIDSEIKRWNSISLKSIELDNGADMKYSYHLWQETARKVGWEPLTLALAYFRSKEKVYKRTEIDPKLVEAFGGTDDKSEANFWNTL